MQSTAVYKQRRDALMANIVDDVIVILPAAVVQYRNADTEYPFRQQSSFYYLSGFNEPNALLVMTKTSNGCRTVLFNQPKSTEKEVWTGKRLGQADAPDALAIDEAYSIESADAQVPEMLLKANALYIPFRAPAAFRQRVDEWRQTAQEKAAKGYTLAKTIEDIDVLIDEMRLIKSDQEIELMQFAASATVEGHKKTMQACRPGMKEYQLQAVLEAEFLNQGCRFTAYPSIVASGENACVLHYMENTADVNEGDLVLIDAGAEKDYYASDVTRTFPANGTFSRAQRKIYQLVLDAQLAAIDAIAPGVHWDRPQAIIVEVLTRGLIDLGLLQGSLDTLIEEKAYRQFYMHNFGHWLGLDTHDVGKYKLNQSPRAMQAGNVLTVEPGLYISASCEVVAEEWRGIGVRIEDDVLVTPTGHRVLSDGLVKTIDDIEALMAGHL